MASLSARVWMDVEHRPYPSMTWLRMSRTTARRRAPPPLLLPVAAQAVRSNGRWRARDDAGRSTTTSGDSAGTAAPARPGPGRAPHRPPPARRACHPSRAGHRARRRPRRTPSRRAAGRPGWWGGRGPSRSGAAAPPAASVARAHGAGSMLGAPSPPGRSAPAGRRERRYHPAGAPHTTRQALVARGSSRRSPARRPPSSPGRCASTAGGRQARAPAPDDADLMFAAEPEYVSRGGLKLAGALDALAVVRRRR